MKISLITPTYNSEKTIANNIRSVLNQSYKDFEHIIIDNKSTDSTLSIIKDLYRADIHKLKLISEKDEGIADAFNKGISNAVGEIVAILNSDDCFYDENVFRDVIKKFSNDRILFVHGDIYSEDPVYGSVIKYPYMNGVENGMPFNHPTMFFRKKIYDTIGQFDKSFKYAMDFEFICRLEKKYGQLKNISEYISDRPLVKMQYGGTSWENDVGSLKETKKALQKNNLWTFKASLILTYKVFKTRTKKILIILGFQKSVKLLRMKLWKTRK